MIEWMDWVRSRPLPDKPWLVLGKGPSFSRHTETDLSPYNLLALNHVVREFQVDLAHMIDVDVVEACAAHLPQNCRWLVMPRRPHVGFKPGPMLLEDFVRQIPVLRELDAQGRLIWYNLSSGRAVGDSPVIPVKFFSIEAALNLLARAGVRTVRSLGIDGGRGYSSAFKDLEQVTMLANGHASFDVQFREIARIVAEHGMDYAPLVEPMRVFVGTDPSQMVATRVLEHSIRKYASGPVELHPMRDMQIPLPRDKKNRPRTGFSFYRFLIPKLCGYRGRALYLDADMQVFGDLAELWQIPFGRHKVLCSVQNEIPPAWQDGKAHFTPGRQMSVMLLDCCRLDWDIENIVRELDEGRYDYKQLMSDLCIVDPHEIGDTIPPAWNSLESYRRGETKLLHYTVVPTQPWKNDENPLAPIWMSGYREAIETGAITAQEVEEAIAGRHVKASLADCLPARRSERGGDHALQGSSGDRPHTVESLQEDLATARDAAARNERAIGVALDPAHRLDRHRAVIERSWSRRIGRAVTQPLRLVRRITRRHGDP